MMLKELMPHTYIKDNLRYTDTKMQKMLAYMEVFRQSAYIMIYETQYKNKHRGEKNKYRG